MVVVKPFGCFLEFSVPLPSGGNGSSASGDDSSGDSRAASSTAMLVGLVHASEVSWDPAVDVMLVVQV